ncbi:MAG: hypothetical protein ACI4D9_05710 [Lachnospiraceae bacterium]
MEKKQKKAKEYEVQTMASVMGLNIATLNTHQVTGGRITARVAAKKEHRQRLEAAGVTNFRLSATIISEKEVRNG